MNTYLVFILSMIGSSVSDATNLRKSPAAAAVEHDEQASQRQLIIDGDDAQQGRYPWMVRYSYMNKLCGGSLIAPDLVLTAAHCFDERDLGIAQVSRFDLSVADEGNPNQAVVDRIQHPGFRNGGRFNPNNDLAILKLERPVTSVTPAKLNFDASFPDESGASPELEMIGWGSTTNGVDAPLQRSDILQESTTSYVPFAECAVAKDPSSGVLFGYNEQRTVVKKSWLCTQSEETAHCKGDSGGPIFQPRSSSDGQDTLVGVISSSVGGCDNAHLPQISLRVSSYANWIMEVGCTTSANPPADWNCPGSRSIEVAEARSVPVAETIEDVSDAPSDAPSMAPSSAP